jgi:hypothetical protein
MTKWTVSGGLAPGMAHLIRDENERERVGNYLSHFHYHFFIENRSGSGKGGSENSYGIYGYTKTNEYERIYTEKDGSRTVVGTTTCTQQ